MGTLLEKASDMTVVASSARRNITNLTSTWGAREAKTARCDGGRYEWTKKDCLEIVGLKAPGPAAQCGAGPGPAPCGAGCSSCEKGRHYYSLHVLELKKESEQLPQ